MTGRTRRSESRMMEGSDFEPPRPGNSSGSSYGPIESAGSPELHQVSYTFLHIEAGGHAGLGVSWQRFFLMAKKNLLLGLFFP
jgi:hypothetical protein